MPFKEEYFDIPGKNNVKFKEEYLCESLRAHSQFATCCEDLQLFVKLMIGIKYHGALHLWFCFSTAFLPIFCSSADFQKADKVQSSLTI
jgi:hypothetical protein